MATIPSEFIFRYQFDCRRVAKVPRTLAAETLGEEYQVPLWSQIPSYGSWVSRTGDPAPLTPRTDANASLFDFRVGWSEKGLFLTVVVAGKEKQEVLSRHESADSDQIWLYLDTRDLRASHRAGRFCHKFAFIPVVKDETGSVKPVAQWLSILRAKDSPTRVDVDSFMLKSELRKDGYAFSCFIPAASLNGYEPNEFNRLGLHFFVLDSAYGAFTLQHSRPLPVDDDPSLWSSFILK